MLTRLSSVISIALVTAGTTAALTATPASAGGPRRCGPGCTNIVAGSRHTIPGRPVTGGGGGGGGGGKAAPIPCPPGNANCNAVTVGAAPVQQIPTIDVAYDARNQLQLPAPHVHTSPADKTYVQLKTGLWVDPADFQAEQAVAAVPGQTVTANARPESIKWNMGESTVTCTDAGSPNGTRCGYTYQRSSAGQPGGKYAISATVTWEVTWTCAGACDTAGGDFGAMSMTTDATLAVGEVQTESRPG